MACKDCGPSSPALATDRLTFKSALDGVAVEVTAVGVLSPRNLSLVKDFLAFTYDQLAAHAVQEEMLRG